MSFHEIFRSEGLPVLQNKMYSSAAAAIASPRGNVILVQDDQSGLIFNSAFEPSKLEYDQEYQNEQACSNVFKRHLEEVTRLIGKHLRGQSVLEVGCGKGYFLEHLQQQGFRIIGIDPAYEGDNPNVLKVRFDKDLGLAAEGIILRHVLEHIHQPLPFLAGIAAANGQRGTIYIEVPCFDWICQRRAWFDIYYEHVNYFRLQDFTRIFGRIYESGRVFGGQYLYLLADLASLRDPIPLSTPPAEMPRDFLVGLQNAITLARGSGGRRNAIWGGASKGVIFACALQRAGLTPDAVIDINPAKQGRFLAGTGLKVAAPDEALAQLSPGDNIFVMNSNYLDEIVTQSGNLFSYVTVDHEQT